MKAALVKYYKNWIYRGSLYKWLAEVHGNRTLFDVYNTLIYFVIFLPFLAAG